MMLALGSEFDTDPQFPWAAETLRDRFSMPHVRALVLHSDLSLYIERVMGPHREYVKAALQRFLDLPPQFLPAQERSIENLRRWMERFFPQKSHDVTDQQLMQISAAATNLAQELNVPSGEDLASVMLVFGHGVHNDPLSMDIQCASRCSHHGFRGKVAATMVKTSYLCGKRQ